MARDHNPVVIDQFNGLWERGGKESVPQDHFASCSDLMYNEGSFKSRVGLDIYDIDLLPGLPVVRMYMYVSNGVEGLLVLDTLGNLYYTNSVSPATPILSIPEMSDFAFTPMNGRAYISPHDGITGLVDEVLYVYDGTGLARPAAGKWPLSPSSFAVANGGTLSVKLQAGYHIFAVTYETSSGFETSPGPAEDSNEIDKNYDFFAFLATGAHKAAITGIPVSPDGFVTKRHIYASKAIAPATFTGDVTAYELFRVPGGTIDDNTTTALEVDFYDADLFQSADTLFDLFGEVPAGVNLNNYHNRLISVGEYGDPSSLETSGLPSTARVSNPGNPEAISQLDGLIVTPLEGNPLTNAQEFRDTLYLFKKTRTYAYNDNGDAPSSWPLTIIDQGIGCSVHGMATVLDSGGINIDYLMMVDFSGIMLFNGIFLRPELSWKIRDRWLALDRDFFYDIQICNDSLNQFVYITLPDRQLLFGDYSETLDAMKIKWSPWTFFNQVNTIALINTDKLVIGSAGVNV